MLSYVSSASPTVVSSQNPTSLRPLRSVAFESTVFTHNKMCSQPPMFVHHNPVHLHCSLHRVPHTDLQGPISLDLPKSTDRMGLHFQIIVPYTEYINCGSPISELDHAARDQRISLLSPFSVVAAAAVEPRTLSQRKPMLCSSMQRRGSCSGEVCLTYRP